MLDVYFYCTNFLYSGWCLYNLKTGYSKVIECIIIYDFIFESLFLTFTKKFEYIYSFNFSISQIVQLCMKERTGVDFYA